MKLISAWAGEGGSAPKDGNAASTLSASLALAGGSRPQPAAQLLALALPHRRYPLPHLAVT